MPEQEYKWQRRILKRKQLKKEKYKRKSPPSLPPLEKHKNIYRVTLLNGSEHDINANNFMGDPKEYKQIKEKLKKEIEKGGRILTIVTM